MPIQEEGKLPPAHPPSPNQKPRTRTNLELRLLLGGLQLPLPLLLQPRLGALPPHVGGQLRRAADAPALAAPELLLLMGGGRRLLCLPGRPAEQKSRMFARLKSSIRKHRSAPLPSAALILRSAPLQVKPAHPLVSVASANGWGSVMPPARFLLLVTRGPSACALNTKGPSAAAAALPPWCAAARWSVASANGSGSVGGLVGTAGTPSRPLLSRRMCFLRGAIMGQSTA